MPLDDNGVDPVLETDKILGMETHSLCKMDSWKKAVSVVRRRNSDENLPSLFMLSTDGFANSYRNEDEFVKICADYYKFLGTFVNSSQKFSFYFGRIGSNILKKEI